MKRYHINPETLRAGVCRAFSGSCPFGGSDKHYPTLDLVHKEIERIYEKEQYYSLFPGAEHTCRPEKICRRPECVDEMHNVIESMLNETDLWPEAKEKVEIIIDEYFQKYGNALVGRTRAVFIDPENNIVYKIPLNDEGLGANSREVYQSELYYNGKDVIPIAKSEYLDEDGLVMVMEKVEPLFSDEDLPVWADYVDCRQVGRTKDGNIVAFDL